MTAITLQIIPAEHWYAEYLKRAETKGSFYTTKKKIVCWALLNNGRVEGLVENDGKILPADGLKTEGYVFGEYVFDPYDEATA
jgi:hypothetical protein